MLFIKKYSKEFEEIYIKAGDVKNNVSVEVISKFINLINNKLSYVCKISISEFKNDYIDSYFEKAFFYF